jgi:hypothetical protein
MIDSLRSKCQEQYIYAVLANRVTMRRIETTALAGVATVRGRPRQRLDALADGTGGQSADPQSNE